MAKVNMNIREQAVYWTKTTGVLPAIKIKEKDNIIPYVHAMRRGGVRLVEVTMTTPDALRHFEMIASEFENEVFAAAGTVLDATTAREAILAGARVIVSPSTDPDVIETANRYGVACYSGAFSATECLTAMTAGADMVKIFPAAVAGPRYMTNLKMVFPEVNLIPSGGVSLDSAPEFIRCGACAVSGARNFFNYPMVNEHGVEWITNTMKEFIDAIARAKADALPLP